MSKMGYNTLQLYTEDTYEIDEPYFGYLRGRYSIEELNEIDKYASTHNIELVPCIQTLAHLGGYLRWTPDICDCNDILLCEDERTYQLIEYLLGSGEVDLAFKLLSSKEYGSFGYLMSVGENTICEKLYPWGSHAHPMFGGVAEFLMSALLGFPVSCVDENILLKPCFPSSVGGVCGSTVIAGKKITVEWERSGNKILLSATIPDTTSATILYKNKQYPLKIGENSLEIDF